MKSQVINMKFDELKIFSVLILLIGIYFLIISLDVSIINIISPIFLILGGIGFYKKNKFGVIFTILFLIFAWSGVFYGLTYYPEYKDTNLFVILFSTILSLLFVVITMRNWKYLQTKKSKTFTPGMLIGFWKLTKSPNFARLSGFNLRISFPFNSASACLLLNLGFKILDLFRISDFGFRI